MNIKLSWIFNLQFTNFTREVKLLKANSGDSLKFADCTASILIQIILNIFVK
jgi:hypothetical protein